jgi:hypothetical protein
MPRFVCLVVASLSLFAGLSSTAGAVTWEANGDQSFTATAGASTLTASGAVLACAGADQTGTVVNRDFTPGVVWDFARGTDTFTSCTLAGSPATMDCGFEWTVTALHGTPVTTSTGTEDITCGVYISGTKLCHVEGVRSWAYHEFTPMDQPKKETLLTSLVTMTGASCPTPGNTHWTPLTFTTTSNLGTRGPVIART